MSKTDTTKDIELIRAVLKSKQDHHYFDAATKDALEAADRLAAHLCDEDEPDEDRHNEYGDHGDDWISPIDMGAQ